MPIYRLEEDITFPPPSRATKEGILAVGGDLSPQRLISAYASGIFPWYSEGEPILWWSPAPRMVLFPKEAHVSRSMQRVMKKQLFRWTVDRNFRGVIDQCQIAPRKNQQGTWITPEMREAYVQLHDLGFAHSLEVWQDNKLVGGIYGPSLGKCFFGESMFSNVTNASKFAFITLARLMERMGFVMLDCQVPNDHLVSLGACEIPRKKYLSLLSEALEYKTFVGKWHFMEKPEVIYEFERI